MDLLAGALDGIISPACVVMHAQRLRQASVPCSFRILPAGHMVGGRGPWLGAGCAGRDGVGGGLPVRPLLCAWGSNQPGGACGLAEGVCQQLAEQLAARALPSQDLTFAVRDDIRLFVLSKLRNPL